jgi:2-octaprenyl-6-methoxyphenol hydroxylase
MDSKQFDVVIIGGSYMGLSLALMLADIGLKVSVIEKNALRITKNPNEPSRLLAIAKASMDIYSRYNIKGLFDTNAEAITYIRVLESETGSHLDFDPEEVGLNSFGVMVEEHNLLTKLYEKAKVHSNISLKYNTAIQDITPSQGFSIITFEDGNMINAKLVIACDGKNSWVRKYFGVSVQKFNYHQSAIVFDVKHELNHEGAAIEKFLPQGPFAILPKPGGFNSCILEIIEEKFGDYLGKIEIVSDVKAFPLELIHAKKYFADRVALAGDAAHAIHPVAGQGLNLGIRDAEALAKLIKQYMELGLDIGSYTMLNEYDKERKPDNNLMIEATHNVNLLFSNNLSAVKLARGFGLRVLNKIPLARKLFMNYAMGLL